MMMLQQQQQQQGERVELHEGASPGTMENSEMEMKIQINDQNLLYKGLKKCGRLRASTAKERISRMPPTTAGKRSSIYRGVTRHRWTGRYEAHLWDKTSWNENQNKKGKQVYLGAYDEEEAAARAYDLAALKYWGAGTQINFPLSDYTRDLDDMKKLSRDAYLQSLRKRSNSVSRGLSKLCRIPRQPYSQWDMNTGNCSTGINVPGLCEYVPGYGLEPRIDLTSHIKWKPLKERWASISKGDLLSEEGKTSEWLNQPVEPYQLPSFGNPLEGKEHSYVTACDILSKSVAFKNLEEKVKAMKMNETVDYALHVPTVGSGESEAPLGVPGMGMFDPQSAQCTLLPDPTMMDGHIDLADVMLWSGIASSAFSLQSAVPCLHLQEHDPESGYIV